MEQSPVRAAPLGRMDKRNEAIRRILAGIRYRRCGLPRGTIMKIITKEDKAERRRLKKIETSKQFRQNNPNYLRQWRASNPEKQRLIWQRANYAKFGLTPEQLQIEIERRFNRCDICLKTPIDNGSRRALHVDHKHGTKKSFRGLLCGHCNTGLGAFFDNPILLARAIQYLGEHS